MGEEVHIPLQLRPRPSFSIDGTILLIVPGVLCVRISPKNRLRDTHQDLYASMLNLAIILENWKSPKYAKGLRLNDQHSGRLCRHEKLLSNDI